MQLLFLALALTMQLLFLILAFSLTLSKFLGVDMGAYVSAENEVWLVDFCVPCGSSGIR